MVLAPYWHMTFLRGILSQDEVLFNFVHPSQSDNDGKSLGALIEGGDVQKMDTMQ